MIRKGRFDEVFFIDLPTEEERNEIFRIHLGRRGIDPDALQVHRLRKITQGWTGAEIEQCVVSALTRARLEDRSATFEDLHRAAQDVIPLSKTMREQVDHIRSWRTTGPCAPHLGRPTALLDRAWCARSSQTESGIESLQPRVNAIDARIDLYY